jgi:pseudouridine-5'-phosphate glycosidase
MPAVDLLVADEVRAALAAGRGVVALESTIIAHGLAWPENLEVARALEAEVRAGGAVPATIAVVDGAPRVGLDGDTIERLARDGDRFRKAGAADLAVAMATGGCAATTVSATAFLAARAGIRLFATGGIGGVHRGSTADVSSDLATLAATPIAVVSAGAKAILDLPRTVEMLETLGVLVLGYGTREFPAFYGRTSGVRLEHRVDTPEEAGAILAARWALGQGGVLVCNPIPEEHAIELGEPIAAALAAATTAGVQGKALTPFLLAHVAAATGGRAARANRTLALNNATLAARISVIHAACAR